MRIIISGGGTGGHIYPAISILEAFGENHEILYVGNKKSMEQKVTNKLNIPFADISIQGFYRKNKIKNIFVLMKLFFACIKSFYIILKFKPEVVIGTGGYVSGPIVFVASLLRKKTFIHEQNAFPGLTNKLLSKVVNKVYISYEESEKRINNDKCMLVGNPIRKAFKNKLSNGISKNENSFIILSFGGSGGALKINELMLELAKKIQKNNEYRLIHVTGRKYYKEFKDEFPESDNIEIFDYLDKMPEYMNNADLIISRAGAISLSEIMYTKTPSILIPSPHVTDDHQTFNAKAMEDKGLSVMIKEEAVNSEEIFNIILNKEKINLMKKYYNDIEYNESADRIVVDIMKEVKK